MYLFVDAVDYNELLQKAKKEVGDDVSSEIEENNDEEIVDIEEDEQIEHDFAKMSNGELDEEEASTFRDDDIERFLKKSEKSRLDRSLLSKERNIAGPSDSTKKKNSSKSKKAIGQNKRKKVVVTKSGSSEVPSSSKQVHKQTLNEEIEVDDENEENESKHFFNK